MNKRIRPLSVISGAIPSVEDIVANVMKTIPSKRYPYTVQPMNFIPAMFDSISE